MGLLGCWVNIGNSATLGHKWDFWPKKNLSFSHPHFNKISGDLTSPEKVGKFDDVAELLGD